mgnify:CR=1 FL=1
MNKPYSVHRPAKNMGDAIRLFCRECCGGHEGSIDNHGIEVSPSPGFAEVERCSCEFSCSLWKYRKGKDPKKSADARERYAAKVKEGGSGLPQKFKDAKMPKKRSVLA